MNPLAVACPACNAQPWRLCSAPTVNGRRFVQYTHYSRDHVAQSTDSPGESRKD